jgi:hypothetical protein
MPKSFTAPLQIPSANALATQALITSLYVYDVREQLS